MKVLSREKKGYKRTIKLFEKPFFTYNDPKLKKQADLALGDYKSNLFVSDLYDHFSYLPVKILEIFKDNLNEIDTLFYQKLNDDAKKTFIQWLALKYEGLEYSQEENINEKIPLSEGNAILDCGASHGDTAILFKTEYPNSPIHIFRSEKEKAEQLKNDIETNNFKDINLNNIFIYSKTGYYYFNRKQNKIVEKNTRDADPIKTTSVDGYIWENKLSNIGLIKFDVETNTQDAINGAMDTIYNQRPILAFPIDFTDNLYEILTTINKISMPMEYSLKRADKSGLNYEYILLVKFITKNLTHKKRKLSEEIFSVKNEHSACKTHKTVTILGFKMKFTTAKHTPTDNEEEKIVAPDCIYNKAAVPIEGFIYEGNPEFGLCSMEERLDETEGAIEYKDMIIANKAIGDKFIKDAKMIVNIGSGVGTFEWQNAKKFPEIKFIASEFDISELDWTKQNRPLENVIYNSDDMPTLLEKYGKFDMAFSIDVIEHTSDYKGFLDDFSKLSDRAVIATPNRDRWADKEQIIAPPYNQHVQEWDAGEFYFMLKMYYKTVKLYSFPDPYKEELVEVGICSYYDKLVAYCEK